MVCLYVCVCVGMGVCVCICVFVWAVALGLVRLQASRRMRPAGRGAVKRCVSRASGRSPLLTAAARAPPQRQPSPRAPERGAASPPRRRLGSAAPRAAARPAPRSAAQCQRPSPRTAPAARCARGGGGDVWMTCVRACTSVPTCVCVCALGRASDKGRPRSAARRRRRGARRRRAPRAKRTRCAWRSARPQRPPSHAPRPPSARRAQGRSPHKRRAACPPAPSERPHRRSRRLKVASLASGLAWL
jgi:hypothetical protein